MKKFNIILAVALTLSTSAALAVEQAPAPAKVDAAAQTFKAKKLNRAEVDALLAKPEKLLIIDVRRPDELTKIGGFPVYLSIPVKDLEASLAYIPKGRTIVTVSNHAVRGGKAADFLASKGFKVAGTIGVQNYEEEGGTLTKFTPPAPKPEAAAKQ